MIVRELLTLLGWDVNEAGADKYDRRTDQAQQRTERATTAMGRAWERVGSRIDSGLARVDHGLATVEAGAQGVANSLGGLAAILGAGLGLAWYAEVTSTFTDLESRLKVALDGSEDAAKGMMASLGEVANMTYQDIEGTIDAYLQLRPNLDALGTSAANQVKVLTSINDAMTVGGIKGDNAARAIMWLNRSFGAGKVTGEAFTNLMESADDVMVQLQASLGVSREQFLAMGKDGKITARMLEDHFLRTAGDVRDQAESMPVTIGDALARMRGKLRMWMYETDRAQGASTRLADAILWFADRPYLAGYAAIAGIGVALLALAAQAVATVATVLRGGVALLTMFRALTLAQLRMAAANPFIWIAAAVVAIQDLITWAEGGDSILGRWIGRFDELSAKAASARTLTQDFFVNMGKAANDTTESMSRLGAAWDKFQSTPTTDMASWSSAISALLADAGEGLWNGGFEWEFEGSPLDKGLKAAGVDASALWARLSGEAAAAWDVIANDLTTELAGAWANGKAGWTTMVDGFKSTWASAVEAMIAMWGKLKAVVLDNAIARGVGGLLGTAGRLLGFGGEAEPSAGQGGPTAPALPPVSGGAPYLVPRAMPGGLTTAPDNRQSSAMDTMMNRGAALHGRLAGAAAGVGLALAPVAAAAGAPLPAQQAAYLRQGPAQQGLTVNLASLSAPVTVERGAIPEGVSEERVAELISSRAGKEAERVLGKALSGAVRHFTEQEV